MNAHDPKQLTWITQGDPNRSVDAPHLRIWVYNCQEHEPYMQPGYFQSALDRLRNGSQDPEPIANGDLIIIRTFYVVIPRNNIYTIWVDGMKVVRLIDRVG